jgi:integrase
MPVRAAGYPWICAYTGARVNEITQLRANDVVNVDGIDCIRITSEAGTVKTLRERVGRPPEDLSEPEWQRRVAQELKRKGITLTLL